MPKKSKLIEPIPASMEEVVRAIFTNYPKPKKNPKKAKKNQPTPAKAN